MKIEPVRGVQGAQASQRARETGGPAFTPAASEAPRVAAMSAAAPTPALDAVLLLQGEGAPDKRRAQARRGKRALDVLERLAQSLLEGRAPGGLRGELQALQAQSQTTGDPGLDDVLREIDTRTLVELAKLERAGVPA